MPVSELRLVKRYAEFCSLDQIKMIPSGTRGLYVLLKKNDRLSRQSPKDKFDVVYIGMARGLKGGKAYSGTFIGAIPRRTNLTSRDHSEK